MLPMSSSGIDRLEQYLAGSYENPLKSVKGCIDAVTDFAGDVAQSDHMTLLAIRYNGRP
jgi:serine phosphatase RsbU (regulator of sigma subunit)